MAALNSKNPVYTGSCIFVPSHQLDALNNIDLEEWESYPLLNGRMIDGDGEAEKRISFDYHGGDHDQSGYVRGFIY